MRLLADACVAGSLVRALRDAGHDVQYAAEGPPGIDDSIILQSACDDQRLIVTEDHDFGALAIRDRRACAGVILVELHGLSKTTKETRVVAALGVDESALRGRFTVVEPSRIRSRPLEPP